MPTPTDPDLRLLVRYLTGDLADNRRADVEKRLDDDPALREALEHLAAVHRMVEQAPAASFDSGFADRVVKRVRSRSGAPLGLAYDTLRTLFLRVALAALLVIGGLGSYNAVRYQDVGATTSAVEAALGLPDVTYGSAVAADLAGWPSEAAPATE